MKLRQSGGLLRRRDGHEAHVTNVELFFDLVYVFAVTQLSHRLLEDLSPINALQSLVLWFAVWLAWQYTCWVTNWFDPDKLPVRLMLFAVMLVGLVMAATIPTAFGERGLVFAGAYVAIQIGRTLFALADLRAGHPLAANFQRMLCWLVVAGALWIAGALQTGETRLWLWIAAVACDYVAPMCGFPVPGLGVSRTRDWTVDGSHMAERCQLFVIVALGESILVTGATLSQHDGWSMPTSIAFLVAFLGSVAMWWFYFNTGSRDGSEAIRTAPDPGRLAAGYHYVHVAIVAGVIVAAVGNELVIAHPDARIDLSALAVLIGGPLLYVVGNGLYKTMVYGRFPLTHIVGIALLAVLAAVGRLTDRLMVAGLVMASLVLVACWETLSRSRPPRQS
jgi:low temperature requirement protein LtrA